MQRAFGFQVLIPTYFIFEIKVLKPFQVVPFCRAAGCGVLRSAIHYKTAAFLALGQMALHKKTELWSPSLDFGDAKTTAEWICKNVLVASRTPHSIMSYSCDSEL